MIDVLLAHGFFLANDPKQVAKMRPYPPLGTLYAAAGLRRRGYRVALFDAMLAGGIDDFEAAVAAHRPRIVALYEDCFHFLNKMCLTHVRQATCRMSELARGAGATVVAAGADVSDQPAVYFDHGVAYALLGEADHSLVELVDHLTNGGDGDGAAAIPGLAWREPQAPGGVGRSAPRLPERRPDAFPFPAWDLVDADAYRRAWHRAHGYFSLNMVTTRGCPFHCNWCAKPIWGQRYAMRSPAAVAEEMAWIKELHRPDHLWFADDIFGLQPKWVEAFAREVTARRAEIPFMIQSRVDLMTPRAVRALARAGCVEVWLGVESGSQKILDAMHKGTRVKAIPPARERLGAAGIRACFFLQFGYPGETYDDVMATVELVRRCLPDDVGISVSYPLPGTKFHAMVREELGEKDHWRESSDLAMMFQGTFKTPFYRHLHRTLHRDLELHHRLRRRPRGELRDELAAVEEAWRELERRAASCRSDAPTTLRRARPAPAAPDLRRAWN